MTSSPALRSSRNGESSNSPTHRAKSSGEGTGNILHVPWQKANASPPRDAFAQGADLRILRPIRSENCATLIASIARGRRWLDELIGDPTASTESIAKRESCSVRKVNMTISLAFLAPDLVRAAIEGRLPHGMGVARLMNCRPNGPGSMRSSAFLRSSRWGLSFPGCSRIGQTRIGCCGVGSASRRTTEAPPRRWSRPGRISGRPRLPKLTDHSRETGSITTACLARSSSPLSPTTQSHATGGPPVAAR